MRIVTPYRPFAPESASHRRLGAFDWVQAIVMLRESAWRAGGVEVVTITDVDTDLPVPTFKYETTYRRLMPWIVEVAQRYIESADFDQDTVMVSPDILVFGDIGRWFRPADFDLGLLARYRAKNPMLNSVQFWPHARRENLRHLYGRVARRLPHLTPKQVRWGGDTTPFVELFGPALPGLTREVRKAGRVKFFEASEVMAEFDKDMIGRPPPTRLVDFKNNVRKHLMRRYFEAVFA